MFYTILTPVHSFAPGQIVASEEFPLHTDFQRLIGLKAVWPNDGPPPDLADTDAPGWKRRCLQSEEELSSLKARNPDVDASVKLDAANSEIQRLNSKLHIVVTERDQAVAAHEQLTQSGVVSPELNSQWQEMKAKFESQSKDLDTATSTAASATRELEETKTQLAQATSDRDAAFNTIDGIIPTSQSGLEGLTLEQLQLILRHKGIEYDQAAGKAAYVEQLKAALSAPK